MKKVFLVLVVIFTVTFFSSCNRDEITLDQIEELIDRKLQEYIGSLEDQISALALNQNNYQDQLDQIANSLISVKDELADIKESQGDQVILIQSLTSLVNQMMNDIEDLDENTLDALEDIYSRLNGFSGDINDLEDIIEDLLDQITTESNHANNELTIYSSNSNPEGTILEVEDNETSDLYTILIFEQEVDRDSNDLLDYKKYIVIHTPGSPVENVINDIELHIENQVYDDFTYFLTGSSETAIIQINMDNGLFLQLDDEYEVELLVEFNSANGTNYSSGQTIYAEITSDVLDLWNVEDVEGHRLTTSQLQGSVKGNVHTLLTEGAYVEIDIDIDALSSSIDSQDDTYEFEIEMEMEPINDDIYIPADVFTAFNIQIFGPDFEIAFNGASSITSEENTITGSDGNEYYQISRPKELTIRILDQPGRGHYFCKVNGYYFTSKDVTAANFSFQDDSTYAPINTDDAMSGWIYLDN